MDAVESHLSYGTERQQAEASRKGPEDVVEQVLEDYRAAVHAKDAAAFAALYDRDVQVFDLWGSCSYESSDA